MNFCECELFFSKWLTTGERVHKEHFAQVASEIGLSGFIDMLSNHSPNLDLSAFINAFKTRTIKSIDKQLRVLFNGHYVIHRTDGPWQITKE